MSKETKVNLNIEELQGFLRHIITNNAYLQSTNKVPTAVNIEGPAGIGKTSAVWQLAKELDYNVIRLNLATIEELGDLVGFPIRQFQLCQTASDVSGVTKTIEVPKVIQVPTTVKVKKPMPQDRVVKKQVLEDGKLIMKDVTITTQVMVEVEEEQLVDQTIMEKQEVPVEASEVSSECIWVDEHAIPEYTKRGYSFTGQKRMSYCPPEWIAGMEDKPGILILDDYSRADQRFIQACMTLIETQKYISWELPKNWTILLTTNPDNGQYFVTPMDIAQKTRFISVNLKFEVDIWAKWAEKDGIDGRCINFLMMHPELVTEKCNARSIVTFFNAISSIPDFAAESALSLIQMIGEGSVGPEFATMFTTFIHNKLDKLVTPKDLLLHDNEAYIIGEFRNCVGKGNDYRADIASVLTSRLINYTLHYAEKNTIYQKQIDRLTRFAIDEETLASDLQYVLVKKIINGNKQKFQKMMTNQKVMEMVMK